MEVFFLVWDCCNEVSKRSAEANFVGIIKISITLIKTSFRNTLAMERIANYVLNCHFLPSLPVTMKIAIFS